jgi:cbb3-type cytochrome oxidase subunit 3
MLAITFLVMLAVLFLLLRQKRRGDCDRESAGREMSLGAPLFF